MMNGMVRRVLANMQQYESWQFERHGRCCGREQGGEMFGWKA